MVTLGHITNNTIADNTAEFGGGITAAATGDAAFQLTLINNVIAFNSALVYGGGGLAVWFVETLQAYGGVFFLAYLGLALWIMFWVFGRLFFAMPAALDHRATSIPQVWAVTRGNGLRMILYQIILIISLAAFGAAVYILFYLLPATVAGAILIAVLDGPSVEAVSLKAKDIEAIVMGWPPVWILITSGLVQIFMFLLYISGWAIVVGSASQAFRDMWPDGLEPGDQG